MRLFCDKPQDCHAEVRLGTANGFRRDGRVQYDTALDITHDGLENRHGR